ncbi:CD151 antigen [Toxorhynchites rutilus septentrionalis]|uniref:CD151 antigen n=1 Tax=Toxorhynchites rutilus septentrionalis TaxID=329112 RepID=UPI0024790C21|nr:CD151 antigen [Toxorhynchites rutilus septentrionalis]
MKLSKIFNHKFVLGSCNLIFMLCGITLLATGFYMFTDAPRILLSRLLISTTEHHKTLLSELEQPLFYYVALGLTMAGLVAITASLLGCWATCMNTYCVLTFYFLIIMTLLIAEFGVCLMITAWPQCLGLNLDETAMVKALQGSYGVPGHEQFTAAMDLAQTIFECCAINTAINYDTALWKLQSLGKKELTVPLTCCKLQNRYEYGAYLDPIPRNLTLCQALQPHDYEGHRHLDGCLHRIDIWYREQYFMFLCAGLMVAVIEFCVLLSIILSCTKLPRKSAIVDTRDRLQPGVALVSHPSGRLSVRDNIYERELPTPVPVPSIRDTYIQPKEYTKSRHEIPFNTGSHYYQISKSYLV